MKGELLAKGATAKLYEWGDKQVLKEFNSDFPQAWIQAEYARAREIVASGIDSPNAFALIELEDKYCIVYERVFGNELAEVVAKQPHKVFSLVRKMAELHVSIHQAQNALVLDKFKDRLRAAIEQVQDLKDHQVLWLLERLEKLPDGDAICHGDYHLKNVMVNAEGKVLAIDWLTAVRGHPIADFARTYVILSERHAEDFETFSMRLLVGIFEPLIFRIYVNHYMRLTGTTQEMLGQWLPIIAAARLLEPSAKHEQLRAMLKRWMPD